MAEIETVLQVGEREEDGGFETEGLRMELPL